MENEKKTYAYISHPILHAIVEGLYRFDSAPQALRVMERLSRDFIVSKKQSTPQKAGPVLKLWINGFALSKEDKDKGYLGHFALIGVRKAEGGRFTLHAEKIPTALGQHPKHKRTKRRHPNWGHPILRDVERGKCYADIETARMELSRLHEEFPETTIPGTDQLHIMLYTRKAEPPIQKYGLRITALPDGTFTIKAKQKAVNVKIEQPLTQPQAVGKYTSMVKLQRKRNKK